MSLKHFHFVFIFMAVICAFGFAAWAFLSPWAGPGMRGLGGFSAALGVFLVGYAAWFWKKSKHVIT